MKQYWERTESVAGLDTFNDITTAETASIWERPLFIKINKREAFAGDNVKIEG